MSKAFTKEDDGSTPERLPDLQISPHPNPVTPRGLAQLQARQKALTDRLTELRASQELQVDTSPISVAERDLRYVEARLSTAKLVLPPSSQTTIIRFGAHVTVADEDGKTRVYHIVGDDESEPSQGMIAAHSPLALALLEATIGDVVDWSKPGGIVELEVTDVTYDEPI